MSELEFTNATAARHLMSRRRLVRKLLQTRSLLRMVRADLRAVRDSCYGLAREREHLAAEVEQLTAAINAAARDHAAVEAERARLSRAVETAEAARDSALEMAADAFRHRDSAQAERERLAGEVAELKADRTRLYQCAEEQGEADVGNGLVLVRKADLLALRSRQTGMDPATVRLLHELLDRLLFVDERGGVA